MDVTIVVSIRAHGQAGSHVPPIRHVRSGHRLTFNHHEPGSLDHGMRPDKAVLNRGRPRKLGKSGHDQGKDPFRVSRRDP
jgi:hypothetical protein